MSDHIFNRISRAALAVVIALSCAPGLAFGAVSGGDDGGVADVGSNTGAATSSTLQSEPADETDSIQSADETPESQDALFDKDNGSTAGTDTTNTAPTSANLANTLLRRFAKGGDYSELAAAVTSGDTTYVGAIYADAAVALYQAGDCASVDATPLIHNYSLLSGAGQLAKAAIVFSAAGLDPASIAINDTTHNVFADIESALAATGALSGDSAAELVWVLPAYKIAGQALDSTLASRIVDAILDAQVTDTAASSTTATTSVGLFCSTYAGTRYPGAQISAQAILALLPYAQRADVQSAIDAAAAAIVRLTNADGGVADSPNWPTSSVDTTGSAVAAFAALGRDTQAMCAYLVDASAASNYTGYNDSYGPQMSAASAAFGLEAAIRAADFGGKYDMFAQYAATPATEDAATDTNTVNSEGEGDTNTTADSTPASDNTTKTQTATGTLLADTADKQGATAACALAFAASSAAALAGAAATASAKARKKHAN